MAKEKTIEELQKENATLKKKLAGKDTHISALKKELNSKPAGASKTVQH